MFARLLNLLPNLPTFSARRGAERLGGATSPLCLGVGGATSPPSSRPSPVFRRCVRVCERERETECVYVRESACMYERERERERVSECVRGGVCKSVCEGGRECESDREIKRERERV